MIELHSKWAETSREASNESVVPSQAMKHTTLGRAASQRSRVESKVRRARFVHARQKSIGLAKILRRRRVHLRSSAVSQPQCLAWRTRRTRTATATPRRPFPRARCVLRARSFCASPATLPRASLPLLRPRSAARGVPVRPRGKQHGPLQAAVERPPVRSVAAIAALACARRRTPPSPGSFWCAFVALPFPHSLSPSLSFRRLLRLDALSPGTTVGPTARFASEETVYRQLRERAYTRRGSARCARAGRALPRRLRPPPPLLATPPARPPAPAHLSQATCSLSAASRPSLAPSPSTRVSLTRARRIVFRRCPFPTALPLPRFPLARRPVPGEQVSGVAIGRGVGRGR